MIKLFIASFLLVGCTECPEKTPPFTKQEFSGRGENTLRRPLYRANVPNTWQRIETEGSLTDTRKPIVTFALTDAVKVYVHTFPSETLEERISPFAQVERWKQQTSGTVQEVSHGGFAGLFFDSPSVLAWSMQLDLEHYQMLSFLANTSLEKEYFKQMRADFTIKATGPESIIEQYREDIFLFANSFELIQELPQRT